MIHMHREDAARQTACLLNRLIYGLFNMLRVTGSSNTLHFQILRQHARGTTNGGELLAFVSIGGLNLFAGIMVMLLRKSAYVQPFSDHLRLATPFLRLNISYKRFLRATSANMATLFPLQSVSGWRAEIIEPLAKMTALVIELNGYPMPQSSLRLFLSPLFFKDTTPHFVILVDDWMKFSNELGSMRAGPGPSAPEPKRNNSILSRLPSKDK